MGKIHLGSMGWTDCGIEPRDADQFGYSDHAEYTTT